MASLVVAARTIIRNTAKLIELTVRQESEGAKEDENVLMVPIL